MVGKMSKRDWRKPRTCFCGNIFMPEWWNQIFCCRGHQRIAHSASHSEMGRKLMKEDPQAALQWYDHLM